MFKMTHPNIIKATDLIDDGNTVAFVMEYVEGETLKEYLELKGKLNDEEIKSMFLQILVAVGYVHEQNLVHRDIKPSNFILDKRKTVKLLDFGIAKNTDVSNSEYTQTGTGVKMGTPIYMSPEQVKSTKDVNCQTDIYSLGVMLWQMVAGKKPYNQAELSVPEIQVKILHDTLPEINEKWDSIIQKATAKLPKDRFVTTQELLSKIKALSDKRQSLQGIESTIIEKGDAIINTSNELFTDLHKEKKIEQPKGFEIFLPGFKKSKFKKNVLIFGTSLFCLSCIIIALIYYTQSSEIGGSQAASTQSLVLSPNSNDMKVQSDFPSVQIGSQVWMKENLNVDRFRNGDLIPEAKSVKEWKSAGENKQPAWCYYGNDPANGEKFGKLYNWFAVNDSRGLAQEGWHIPTQEEINQLCFKLGGERIAGRKMKAKDSWKDNGNGNDESKFHGLPGGGRDCQGNFDNLGEFGFWWLQTYKANMGAESLVLYSEMNDVMVSSTCAEAGKLVRCIKD
jgi:uncharacterized protein (TIGR02145 family)